MAQLLRTLRIGGDDDKRKTKKLAMLRSYYKVDQPEWARSLDFRSLRRTVVLGIGTYGHVYLATTSDSRNFLAIKVMKKDFLIARKQVDHIFREVECLETVRHPFMIDLFAKFKDDKYLYLAMNYVPGGELFSVLVQYDRLSEDMSRFYASQVAMFLDSMHQENYLYRDLKPENILLDREGYLKVADMGFAKYVPAGTKTYTTCGTPEYMSPENVMMTGYDRSNDWWGLGILIYEMLFANTPWSGETVMQLQKNIKQRPLAFPSDVTVSRQCVDLLKGLLSKDAGARYGCMIGGVKDIFYSSWFSKVNWKHEDIIRRRREAPWKPNLKHDGDTSNFDDFPADTEVPRNISGTVDPFAEWPVA